MALADLVTAVLEAGRRPGKPRSSIERPAHWDGHEKTEVQITGASNNHFIGHQCHHQRHHGSGNYQASGERDFVAVVTLIRRDVQLLSVTERILIKGDIEPRDISPTAT